MNESTQKDDEDQTTATSFEFVAPNAYKSRQIAQQVTPIPDESNTIDEIPNRIDIDNESVYIQDENPDDKENVPPIDDKENIPPPPLHALHRNHQPFVYKTPEKTIDNNELSVLPNDLQKGVDLINALIDSRTTDGVTKKKLIRKIVRHLLKSKDTKDLTQMIMSYSEKSNTKASGVSSLELEESEQSGGEKATKDTISGISALSSSSSVATVSIGKDRTPVNSGPEEKIDNINDEDLEKVVQTLKEDTMEVPTEKQLEQQNEVVNEERKIKDWLLPVTQSEIEKENARKSKSIQEIEKIEVQHPKDIPIERRASDQLKRIEKPTKNNEILEFLENEKKTHNNWIDQEIEHLKNLKILLQNINAIDSDDSKGNVSEEKINSVYAKPNRNYLSIYENFRRNVKHTSRNGSQADVSSTLIGTNINQLIKTVFN